MTNKTGIRFVELTLTLDDHTAVAELAKRLRRQLPQLDPNIRLINKIITTADGDIAITAIDMAAAYEKSERWLQQLFQTYIGLGLKWFLQRNKLLYAARQIREAKTPQWAAIAYDAGYSSQQHFITDFKKATGSTPLQYKKELS